MSGALRLKRRSPESPTTNEEIIMSEFLYVYRGGQRPSTPEAMQQEMQRWVAWMKELGEKGHMKNLGHPLEPSGKVVSGKDKNVSDGPFAEAKDVIGGYTLIEAKDLAEAAELAKGCPVLLNNGHVEIRPIRVINM
jgi:hypothetical protein